MLDGFRGVTRKSAGVAKQKKGSPVGSKFGVWMRNQTEKRIKGQAFGGNGTFIDSIEGACFNRAAPKKRVHTLALGNEMM